ncbi:MAG: threonine synthase [Candidatus Poribacteria bacterium]|nr:MAG: threonine synthase [Candidatus Poribacteria bacterium]
MSRIRGLRCRECGAEYPTAPLHVCEMCFGPLEVVYDYEEIAQVLSRERIASGPPNHWRYQDLLPLDGEPTDGHDTGYTPLLPARNLAAALGVREVWIKNDSVCAPTLSFKDRVVSVALSKAKEFGFDTVACASTGNLANAVAAHAARAGLRAFIFIPADLELGKVVGTSIYRPHLVGIEGTYDEVNRLCSEIAGVYPWAFVNINIRPFYSEGSKTFGFEILEQLGWRAPDHIVVPCAGGSLITKVRKAIQEFHKLGLIDRADTKVHAAQAAGCGPIVTAIREGEEFVRPVRPNTIAKSLAIGNPADGIYAVAAARESGGFGAHATDEEIVAAIELLASTEGIFTETAGGVTLAATKRLIEEGRIGRDDSVVISITGNGLKTLEVVQNVVKPAYVIPPRLEAFQELMKTIE